MDQNVTGPEGTPETPSRGLVVLAAVLALIALGVSGYLSLQTLTGQAVAGCGADDGCGAVLASPWSRVLGIPVSLLGSATYLAVLAGLGLRLTGHGKSKLGDFLLLASAPAMLIAAGWFTYIQLVEIEEICLYCMVDHGIGVVLGVLLPVMVVGTTVLKPALPIVLGLVGCAGIIVLQHLTLEEDTLSTENLFVNRDGDVVIDGKRYVSLFGGELQFTLEETPHIGDPRAKQVVAVVFDYGCPHCRVTHALLEEAIEADSSAFVLVAVPISINPEHNAYIKSDNERFEESYWLAVLAEAVAAVDLGKWKAFDHWLFSPETAMPFPRSFTDARAKAIDLIGEDALNAQYTEAQIAKHQATIKRNIELMALIPEDSRYIPVVTSPGAPRHLTERFYEIDVLRDLLKQAEENLKTIGTDDTKTTGN